MEILENLYNLEVNKNIIFFVLNHSKTKILVKCISKRFRVGEFFKFLTTSYLNSIKCEIRGILVLI
jgi:hypothetical protein